MANPLASLNGAEKTGYLTAVGATGVGVLTTGIASAIAGILAPVGVAVGLGGTLFRGAKNMVSSSSN